MWLLLIEVTKVREQRLWLGWIVYIERLGATRLLMNRNPRRGLIPDSEFVQGSCNFVVEVRRVNVRRFRFFETGGLLTSTVRFGEQRSIAPRLVVDKGEAQYQSRACHQIWIVPAVSYANEAVVNLYDPELVHYLSVTSMIQNGYFAPHKPLPSPKKKVGIGDDTLTQIMCGDMLNASRPGKVHHVNPCLTLMPPRRLPCLKCLSNALAKTLPTFEGLVGAPLLFTLLSLCVFMNTSILVLTHDSPFNAMKEEKSANKMADDGSFMNPSRWPQEQRCQGIRTDGKQCRRKALSGRTKCLGHKNQPDRLSMGDGKQQSGGLNVVNAGKKDTPDKSQSEGLSVDGEHGDTPKPKGGIIKFSTHIPAKEQTTGSNRSGAPAEPVPRPLEPTIVTSSSTWTYTAPMRRPRHTSSTQVTARPSKHGMLIPMAHEGKKDHGTVSHAASKDSKDEFDGFNIQMLARRVQLMRRDMQQMRRDLVDLSHRVWNLEHPTAQQMMRRDEDGFSRAYKSPRHGLLENEGQSVEREAWSLTGG
ncbi:hypothetical protein DPSP01_012133 [Paraphaeosphaeria sporulosa]